MIQMSVNALALASIYFLFAVGMSLVWGSIGVLNFSHGAIFMGSAFASFIILQHVQLPLIAVIGIGIVIGAMLAVFVQLVAFGPILRREKSRHAGELQIIAAGIGLASVIIALAQMRFNEPFGLAASSFKITTINIGGVLISNISLIIVGLAATLGIGLTLWLRLSIQGTALRSIGVDARTASLMGINRARMALAALAVSGGMAGLAGTMLTLYLGAIETTSGESFLIKAFAIIVLGGVGSIPGAILGSVALAVAETLLLGYTSGTWVDVVSFGLIFAILLVRPHGIFGRKEVRRT
jgi:branched-chain amino acid transport system permease protein